MKINCDFAEGYGRYDFDYHESMLEHLDMINVACGFHAGDPKKILDAIILAKKYDVKIGAHPSYFDLRGFGRLDMQVPEDVLYADLVYQIGALKSMCESQGVHLYHVKPHGALYNKCAKNEAIARLVIGSIKAVDPNLVVVGLSGSIFIKLAKENGLKVLEEAFVDRAYEIDGTLMNRSKVGAVLPLEKALEQVKNLRNGYVLTPEGKINLRADTICIHGDGKDAVDIVKSIKSILKK